MVIIEAMRYGKPIVASNVGGISEIVVDDENGYTVENASSAFAEKIQYIFENESIEAVPKLQLLEQAIFIRSFPKMRTDDFENV